MKDFLKKKHSYVGLDHKTIRSRCDYREKAKKNINKRKKRKK